MQSGKARRAGSRNSAVRTVFSPTSFVPRRRKQPFFAACTDSVCSARPKWLTLSICQNFGSWPTWAAERDIWRWQLARDIPTFAHVVFDLPDVVEMTKGYLDNSGLPAERISVTAGDFFRDPLPEADLIAVGRILHDWSDAKVGQLLAKVFETLPSGGAILIAEKLLDEQKTGPTSALLQSLNMLVCTEGRERTLSEYRELLEAAGFEKVEGRVTGAYLDASDRQKALTVAANGVA